MFDKFTSARRQLVNDEIRNQPAETDTNTSPVPLSYLFVYQDGDQLKSVSYNPNSAGGLLPLNKQTFESQLQTSETARYKAVANSVGIPDNLMYGIGSYTYNLPKTYEQTHGYPLQNTHFEGGIQETVAPKPTVVERPHFVNAPHITEKYSAPAQTNPVVVSETSDTQASSDSVLSFAPAVATYLMADILDSRGIVDRVGMSDKQLGEFFAEYVKQQENRVVTEQETKKFITDVRSYKPDVNFKPSVVFDSEVFNGKTVAKYNRVLHNSRYNTTQDDWYNARGKVIDYFDPKTMTQYPAAQRAVDLFTKPQTQFNTRLDKKEEKAFKKWFDKLKDDEIISANEDGRDYDYRGAFKAGYQPVKQEDGTYHWTDKFKKPNHATFSNESQYAKGVWANYAGTWAEDGTFTTPQVVYPRNLQQEYMDYLEANDKLISAEEYAKEAPAEAEIYRQEVKKRKRRAGIAIGFAAGLDEEVDEGTFIEGVDTPDKASAKIQTTKALGEAGSASVVEPPQSLVDYIQKNNYVLSGSISINTRVSASNTETLLKSQRADFITRLRGGLANLPQSLVDGYNALFTHSLVQGSNQRHSSRKVFKSTDPSLDLDDEQTGVISFDQYRQNPYQSIASRTGDPDLDKVYNDVFAQLSQIATLQATPEQQQTMINAWANQSFRAFQIAKEGREYDLGMRRTVVVPQAHVQKAKQSIEEQIEQHNINYLGTLPIVDTYVGSSPARAYRFMAQLVNEVQTVNEGTFNEQTAKGTGTSNWDNNPLKQLACLALSHYNIFKEKNLLAESILQLSERLKENKNVYTSLRPEEDTSTNKGAGYAYKTVFSPVYEELSRLKGPVPGLQARAFDTQLRIIARGITLMTLQGADTSTKNIESHAKALAKEYTDAYFISRTFPGLIIAKEDARHVGITNVQELDRLVKDARVNVEQMIEEGMLVPADTTGNTDVAIEMLRRNKRSIYWDLVPGNRVAPYLVNPGVSEIDPASVKQLVLVQDGKVVRDVNDKEIPVTISLKALQQSNAYKSGLYNDNVRKYGNGILPAPLVSPFEDEFNMDMSNPRAISYAGAPVIGNRIVDIASKIYAGNEKLMKENLPALGQEVVDIRTFLAEEILQDPYRQQRITTSEFDNYFAKTILVALKKLPRPAFYNPDTGAFKGSIAERAISKSVANHFAPEPSEFAEQLSDVGDLAGAVVGQVVAGAQKIIRYEKLGLNILSAINNFYKQKRKFQPLKEITPEEVNDLQKRTRGGK